MIQHARSQVLKSYTNNYDKTHNSKPSCLDGFFDNIDAVMALKFKNLSFAN